MPNLALRRYLMQHRARPPIEPLGSDDWDVADRIAAGLSELFSFTPEEQNAAADLDQVERVMRALRQLKLD
jgi:hypothetical protein